MNHNNDKDGAVTFVADKQDEGTRLDQFLNKVSPDASLTRTYIQNMILLGRVMVNQQARNKNYRLREGDIITADLLKAQQVETAAQDIPLTIVFEDPHLIVVDKKAGMVVHPSPGNWDSTLVNALLFHCGDSLSGINGQLRPGIVHRIDKDTSGLLVAAKSDFAHQGLAYQFAEHTVERQYTALCYGHFEQDSGVIDRPIGRSERYRTRFCVTDKNSKPAITSYKVTEQFSNCALVLCTLATGRTHQIRVHMCDIGHPLVGDPLYRTGYSFFPANGQKLHAGLLGFYHPQTGQLMRFTSDLPPGFQDLLTKIRRRENGEID